MDTTEMKALKERLMALPQAELQHLLFHLQKHRDDLLILMTFTKEFFTMDNAAFRDFKNWLLYNEAFSVSDVLSSVFATLKDQEDSDSESSSDTDSVDTEHALIK